MKVHNVLAHFGIYTGAKLHQKVLDTQFFDLRECVPGVDFSIRPLLPEIQERLLDSISFVVAKTPYRTTRGVTPPVVRQLRSPSTPSTMEVSGPALTQLALHTLTTFDLQVHLISSLNASLLLISTMNGVLKRLTR